MTTPISQRPHARNVDTILKHQGTSLETVLANAVRYDWSWRTLEAEMTVYQVAISDVQCGALLTDYKLRKAQQ